MLIAYATAGQVPKLIIRRFLCSCHCWLLRSIADPFRATLVKRGTENDQSYHVVSIELTTITLFFIGDSRAVVNHCSHIANIPPDT